MKKETLHKKWHFKLIQIIFWVLFIFFMLLGIVSILIEDDMPYIGFVWAAVLAGVYWVIRRIFR